jgi:NAD(P)-dependent dehydrogenase (short-subunit alcohol dehydrogenase family)
MTTSFEGRVALITGASRGIGLATAEVFIEAGASVVLGDIDIEGGRASAERIGPRAAALNLDVTSEKSVAAAVAETRVLFGRIDVLVANAGIAFEAPAHETSLEDWRRVIGVNLTGAFLSCQQALLAFLEQGEGGVLICHASMSGQVGIEEEAAYCASKAGVVGLVRSIAVDYAKHGVRCNAVCPGVIQTPMTDALWRAHGDEFARRVADQHLLGIGEPRDVAHFSAFLASPEAKHITGGVFFVDGGYTAV